MNCKIVDGTPSKDAKVLSIAQDLIYAESSDKKQTHKSLALGMAVRQITGSMRLLRIRHGLGHTVSTATVYRHDTAPALLSRDEEGTEITIPCNIIPNVFATIVWDNNDFNEETVSGKGTTHVTNGIIVQNAEAGPRPAEKITISKSILTIKAPETYINLYTSKERGTLPLSSIIYIWRSCSRQKSVEKNMADFHS